jgi:nucleoside-diphosphate-sugar epimerase
LHFNYVYIEDVTKAHILALEKGNAGEKYIIGGENASYEKLFNTISECNRTKIPIVKINYTSLKAGLFLKVWIDKLLFNEPSITPKLLDYLFTNRSVSSQKAVSQLGHEITTLKAGVEQTLQFLKN